MLLMQVHLSLVRVSSRRSAAQTSMPTLAPLLRQASSKAAAADALVRNSLEGAVPPQPTELPELRTFLQRYEFKSMEKKLFPWRPRSA